MSEDDFHIMLLQKAALTRSLGITSLILKEYGNGDRDRACRAAEMLSRIVLETGSVDDHMVLDDAYRILEEEDGQ